MNKYRIKSWYCETIDKDVFVQIIDGIKDIKKDKIVRANNNRTVYRIKVNGTYYYIKLIHPKPFRHKIREIFWFTKSYSEYKSALFLDKVGLDVVKVIGWAKKGYKSFLVTEDAGLHTVNARDFWMKTAKNNPYVKEEFLSSLSYFLRKCIYVNFKHPDFHLGNILLKVTKDDIKFIFVDPDGVRFKTRKMSLTKQWVSELLGGMLTNDLTCEESLKLLLDSNIIENESEYDAVWLKLRKFSVKQVNAIWHKRKKKVLNKESRFSYGTKDRQNNRWYLRKDAFGKVILEEKSLDINILSNKYKTETLSYKASVQKWLLSFYMQFQAIPHVRVIALYISHNKQETVIVYEGFEKDSSLKIEKTELKRIKLLCETANVTVDSFEDAIVYKGTKPLLIGCKTLKIL